MDGKLLVALLLISLLVKSFAKPSSDKLRFIKTGQDEEGHWVNEETILDLVRNHVGFSDITNLNVPNKMPPRPDLIASIPTTIEFEVPVKSAIELIQPARIQAFLDHFTSYFNRHYRSETGAVAAEWLLGEVDASIRSAGNYTGEVRAQFWNHTHEPDWVQRSVLVRIGGSDPLLAQEVVIIGAHLDSINVPEGPAQDYSKLKAPGANDNASGAAVLLEALRVLLQNNFIPKRTVEFQWYAAEEEGLRGSTDIANAYYNLGIKVISMVNFDMAAYSEGVRSVGLIENAFTEPTLTGFLRRLIERYLVFNTTTTIDCPGGRCSDHVSFMDHGFPAASPVEPVINGVRHTEWDNMTIVNVEQLTEFTKLGISYVMEVGKVNAEGSGSSVSQLSLGFTATIIIFSSSHLLSRF